MKDTVERIASWRSVLIAAMIVGLVGLAAVAASAADATQDRLDRKVRVMERVIDQVLVDSPNVLVAPSGNVRGLVLDEFGALFTLEGRVGFPMLRGSRGPRFVFEGMKGMAKHIIVDRDDDEQGDDDELVQEKSLEELEKETEQRAAEQYAGLKTELLDALIDYGPTLSELRDDQWVGIVAFLDGALLFDEDGGRRLTLKVKMRDLRQHASGATSRDAAIKRVSVEER